MTQSAAILVLAAVVLASAPVPPALAEAGADSIFVDCSTRAMPSQAAVGRLLGVDNLSAAYTARQQLMVTAGRACQRKGATLVRVVLTPAAAVARSRSRSGASDGIVRAEAQATP